MLTLKANGLRAPNLKRVPRNQVTIHDMPPDETGLAEGALFCNRGYDGLAIGELPENAVGPVSVSLVGLYRNIP